MSSQHTHRISRRAWCAPSWGLLVYHKSSHERRSQSGAPSVTWNEINGTNGSTRSVERFWKKECTANSNVSAWNSAEHWTIQTEVGPTSFGREEQISAWKKCTLKKWIFYAVLKDHGSSTRGSLNPAMASCNELKNRTGFWRTNVETALRRAPEWGVERGHQGNGWYDYVSSVLPPRTRRSISECVKNEVHAGSWDSRSRAYWASREFLAFRQVSLRPLGCAPGYNVCRILCDDLLKSIHQCTICAPIACAPSFSLAKSLLISGLIK